MIDTYLKAFAQLKSDRSPKRWSSLTSFRAPHKPLLLLAVIDLISQGATKSNVVEITPDLGETFTLYWARVMPPDQRGSLALPFFHLKSDGFWRLIARPGYEHVLQTARQIRSINQLRETVLGARLDGELYRLLRIDKSRNLLRAVLIETYFAPEAREALLEQASINNESIKYSEALLDQARGLLKEVVKEPYRAPARDQGFRRAIGSAYHHRCAFCGVRVITADGHSVVDAAHVIPWSVGHNDEVGNGIALCRLCHWSFDEGMLSVSSSYEVLSSRQLSAGRNIAGHVVTMVGRKIIGPEEESFWPYVDSLAWHRRNVFRSG